MRNLMLIALVALLGSAESALATITTQPATSGPATRVSVDRSTPIATVRTILTAIKADDVNALRACLTISGNMDEPRRAEWIDIQADAMAIRYLLPQAILSKFPDAPLGGGRPAAAPSAQLDAALRRLADAKFEMDGESRASVDIGTVLESSVLDRLAGEFRLAKRGQTWLCDVGDPAATEADVQVMGGFMSEQKRENEVFRKLLSAIRAGKFKTFDTLQQTMESIGPEVEKAQMEGREPRFDF